MWLKIKVGGGGGAGYEKFKAGNGMKIQWWDRDLLNKQLQWKPKIMKPRYNERYSSPNIMVKCAGKNPYITRPPL